MRWLNPCKRPQPLTSKVIVRANTLKLGARSSLTPERNPTEGQGKTDETGGKTKPVTWWRYCWWFRNLANHLECIKPCYKKGKNYQPQLVSLPDFWLINHLWRFGCLVILGVVFTQFLQAKVTALYETESWNTITCKVKGAGVFIKSILLSSLSKNPPKFRVRKTHRQMSKRHMLR